MALQYREIIKGSDTPVLVRANGVNFPSYTDIAVRVGSEEYKKTTHAANVVTHLDDITLLELKLGALTSLANNEYTLHIEIFNSDYPNGFLLSDCVIEKLTVTVRDKC